MYHPRRRAREGIPAEDPAAGATGLPRATPDRDDPRGRLWRPPPVGRDETIEEAAVRQARTSAADGGFLVGAA